MGRPRWSHDLCGNYPYRLGLSQCVLPCLDYPPYKIPLDGRANRPSHACCTDAGLYSQRPAVPHHRDRIQNDLQASANRMLAPCHSLVPVGTSLHYTCCATLSEKSQSEVQVASRPLHFAATLLTRGSGISSTRSLDIHAKYKLDQLAPHVLLIYISSYVYFAI